MDDITSAFPIINNRYKILNTIASGGMAVIYRAKDIVLDRNVAIKLLKRNLSNKPAVRSQFETEAKASASLSHPNVISTFDFGLFKGRLFIVMELIDGNHLKNLILNNDLSSIEKKYNLIIQACKGLAYAHAKGIVHCDIKPQNMLISVNGILKITDFGISQTFETISRIGNKNEVWGSPYYISPEVAAGQIATPASDVYSMGIVMYEVFTGELPFQGEDTLAVIEKHQKKKPVTPSNLNDEIVTELENIILKAIEKKPINRFSDGKSLLSGLEIIKISNNDPKNNSKIQPSQLMKNESDHGKAGVLIEKEINWVTILLSFLAIITIGGLIPFWLFVYYSINR